MYEMHCDTFSSVQKTLSVLYAIFDKDFECIEGCVSCLEGDIANLAEVLIFSLFPVMRNDYMLQLNS